MHTKLQDIARWIANRMPADMQANDWKAVQQTFPWYTIPYWLQAAENPENSELAAKAAISGGNQFLLHILLQPTEDAVAQPTGQAQTIAPVSLPEVPAEQANALPEEDSVISEPEKAVTTENDDIFNKAAAQLTEATEPETIEAEAFEAEATAAELPLDATVEASAEEESNAAELPDEATAAEAITEASEKIEEQLPQVAETIQVAEPEEASKGVTTETDSEDYQAEEEENADPPELGSLNLKGLSKMMHEPVAATDPLAASEPFHTIDYFASQGIKAEKAKANPQVTHFDNQVKSFTEWLKSMKKLHYQPATAYTDPLVEKKARQSLQEGEVVTESMAEVWVKQGNFSEAVKIYQKLMVIHPEKSHYFAALIKQVN